MTQKIIVNRDGDGLAKNPYTRQGIHDKLWHDFELKNNYLPTFLPDGSIAPEGEFEAEIVKYINGNFGIMFLSEIMTHPEQNPCWRIIEAKEEEPTVQQQGEGESHYWNDFDPKYQELVNHIHAAANTLGWKDFYYQVLKYQATMIDSGYKLIAGASDDYRKLLRMALGVEKHQSPIQQPPASYEVTAEEILAKHTGANVKYLDSRNRIIMAMHEYAALKNDELESKLDTIWQEIIKTKDPEIALFNIQVLLTK